MPMLNGFEVLERVRRDPDLATTPVILPTSLQDRHHMRQGMSIGGDDYLTKPFAPQELREAVSAQLNQRVLAQVVYKALQVALDAQRQKIGELYEMRMAQSLSAQWPDGGAG
jgi:DNA-binding response OmpR family regulator